MRPWRVLEGRPSAGLEFEESGRTIQFQTFEECLEKFPSCGIALGEVEQTDFSFAPPAMHLRSEVKCVEGWAFGEHRECLWGLTMGSSPMRTQSPASTNEGESSEARRSPGED